MPNRLHRGLALLCLAIILLAAFPAQAAGPAPSIPLNQPLRFERFSIEDGLSQNAGLALLQDRQGFLWVGTQDGLNRYDGYGFTVYKNNPQNTDSLSSSSVIALFQDQAGILWVGTWGGGLNRFDPLSGHFTRFRHNAAQPASLANDLVTAIHEDRQGRLWVATCGGGLDLLDRSTGQFTHHQHDPAVPSSLGSDFVSTIFEDASGGLWLGTGCFGNAGAGLERFDPNNPAAAPRRFRAAAVGLAGLSSDNVSSIVQDSSGVLWVGTGGYALQGGGINRLDPQTGQVSLFRHDPADPNSLASDDLMNVMIDSSGLLWAATWGGGLDVTNPGQPSAGQALTFSHQRYNPFQAHSLSSNMAWALLQDRSGLVWVGTANGGLNKLNPQVQSFGLYRSDPGDPHSLSSSTVGPILEDSQGHLWVGTLGAGLERFDRASGQFTHFGPQAANDAEAAVQQAGTYLDLLEDRSGVLWAGTISGLARFDPASGAFTYLRHDPADPDSLVNDSVSNLLEDNAGRLWVGTIAGLDYYDRAANRFVHVRIPELATVFRLFQDRQGNIWVGSWGQGVFRLDPASVAGEQVSYVRFVHDPAKPASLAEDSAVDIFQDKAGALWFGTQAGLDRLNPDGQSFTHFQEKDGLANNTVLCIQEDQQGQLWISTNGGLSRFTPSANSFHNYYASDGLQSNEFDSGSCALSRAGEMYFGGQQGLNIFRPETIQDNTTPPPVAITSFMVFNRPVQVDLSGATPLNLDSSENFISFEFVALDFHAPDKNRYAYKLEGFDPEWVDAGSRRYASYTNLNGGSYTFLVRAANNDGVWNESGVSLALRVTPPFWQEPWFITLGVVGLLALVGGAMLWRVSNLRYQARRLESLVETRTAELRQTNAALAVEVEQRKRAEAALSSQAATALGESEARFRAIYDYAEMGIVLLNLAGANTGAEIDEGAFHRLIASQRGNPAFQRMFGYSEAELAEIDLSQLIYPEDRGLDAELSRELFTGLRDAYRIEKRYVRKDGQVFWGRLNYSLVRGAGGAPGMAIGIIEDIDDEKRAQENLRLSEARFRAMFDNATVGMALSTLDRHILQINHTAEQIIGYTFEEMRDMNPVNLAIPEDRQIGDDYFAELVSGKREQFQVERHYVRKDGTIFWARITYSLVRGPGGVPEYLIGLIEDIDDEKRTQEKLAEQEARYRRTLEQRVAERTAELRQANDQLQAAIEQTMRAEAALAQKAADEAVVAERNRLARDLHDAVTQTLFSASLIADVVPQLWEINPPEAMKRLAELRELTRGALAEMRTLLLELRPSALTDSALPDLLRQLSEALIGRARLPIQLSIDGECSMPPNVQVAFYRIAQEALNNVAKYAKATQVSMNLRMEGIQARSVPGGGCTDDSPLAVSTRLTIMDNGVGFDPAAIPPNHLGLRIMRERAEAIGARLSIYSEPGEGTQVTVFWQRPAD